MLSATLPPTAARRQRGCAAESLLRNIYRTDIQGNIIAILDGDGDVVVEYKYNAWGNQLATGNSTLASINPFRYRSYYFDTETGLYYLQTRYYDPETGRFLNLDSLDYSDPETINGLNLYAYCGNNPIMNVDLWGTSWNSFWNSVGNWLNKAGNAIKDFFVEDVYGEVIKPAIDWVSDVAAPTVSNFFSDTIPDFFVNTFWNDWIVDKTWNQFIVGTVWNKGLVPAWNWVSNNWQSLIDGISGVFSIGSGFVGILSAIGVVSIPVAGQIILGVVSVGFGIYSIGRIFKWW